MTATRPELAPDPEPVGGAYLTVAEYEVVDLFARHLGTIRVTDLGFRAVGRGTFWTREEAVAAILRPEPRESGR